MQKLRVGVFMGGKSIEREVSLNSGRTVCDHLDTSRYDVVPIFQRKDGQLFFLPMRFLHRGKIADFEQRLDAQAQPVRWTDLKNHIDFMYLAVHGRYGEDGILQGFLEVLGIPYLGSKVLASALGMDKAVQRVCLHAAGIEVPRGCVVTLAQAEELEGSHDSPEAFLVRHNLQLPLVVKPQQEGSSLGISVVTDPHQLAPALRHACCIQPERVQHAIVEERIEGMEFSCITVMDRQTGQPMPMPPTEIVVEADRDLFDYDQKYMPGRAKKYTPARCSVGNLERIKHVCAQITHLFDIATISRIDGFLTPDDRVVIIDVNTFSGMSPSSFLFREAAELGLNHRQLINHLIETELRAYGMDKSMREGAEVMTSSTKMRIAVLMGGDSHERETSFDSGRNVTYKLSPDRYNVTPVFVDDAMRLYPLDAKILVRNSTREVRELVDQATQITWDEIPDRFDFVFLGLHGGRGENGAVQGALEMLEVPYNGSGVLTSALCMDKYRATRFLASQGFDVPAGLLVSRKEWDAAPHATLNSILAQLTFPLILKPHDDGCSIGVFRATQEADVVRAVEAIFDLDKTQVLIEEQIQGMELTVGVMGNGDAVQALVPTQAVAAKGILSIEEKFLPGAGENQTPAPLPVDGLEFVRTACERVYRALGCAGYARIDGFYQEASVSPTGVQRFIFLEANTLPALTPATCFFHQAAELGITPMQVIDRIVELGCELHARATSELAAAELPTQTSTPCAAIQTVPHPPAP